MSITRSVSSVVKTFTAPLAPAGRMTAFAVIAPVTAFKDATRGCACPAGHAVRNPKATFGTAVKFKEYASATAGTPHAFWIGNERVSWADKLGAPRRPSELRVSAMRH